MGSNILWNLTPVWTGHSPGVACNSRKTTWRYKQHSVSQTGDSTGTWRPQMRHTISFLSCCAVEVNVCWSKWWVGVEWREGECILKLLIFVEQWLLLNSLSQEWWDRDGNSFGKTDFIHNFRMKRATFNYHVCFHDFHLCTILLNVNLESHMVLNSTASCMPV